MDPDYLFTARIFRFLGADVAYDPLNLLDGQYVPDLDLIETEFRDRGAKQIVFSHPNNPTGVVYSAETIAAIGRLNCIRDWCMETYPSRTLLLKRARLI